MVNDKYFLEIKALRAKHNESQKECAEVIGKSILSYRKKEKGLIDFKWYEVMQLMDHWKEPLSKLET